MLKYWSNIFGMIGVAIIGTVVFRPDDWLWGVCLGIYLIGIGAWFHGLALPIKGGRK